MLDEDCKYGQSTPLVSDEDRHTKHGGQCASLSLSTSISTFRMPVGYKEHSDESSDYPKSGIDKDLGVTPYSLMISRLLSFKEFPFFSI